MTEVDEAAKIISAAADPDANIIFGATIDETMHDQIRITVVATGFDQTKQRLQKFVIQQPQPVIPGTNLVRRDLPEENASAAPQQGSGQGGQDQQQPQPQPEEKKPENIEDEWDIPAFLRQRN
jgi:cell division protein FtsZ